MCVHMYKLRKNLENGSSFIENGVAEQHVLTKGYPIVPFALVISKIKVTKSSCRRPIVPVTEEARGGEEL